MMVGGMVPVVLPLSELRESLLSDSARARTRHVSCKRRQCSVSVAFDNNRARGGRLTRTLISA